MILWNIKPEPLWTDWLIFLLVIAAIAFALYARGHEHLRAPWRQIIRRRLAMSSLVILSVYIGIGLLDSIHFRLPIESTDAAQESHYSPEVLSLLDYAVTPLREQVEKSYSMPFAAYLYTKETIESPDGASRREYPRLLFGGAHLPDPKPQWRG